MAEDIKKTTSHEYHYIKTNDFRSVFVTGAIGGPTVLGLLDMNVFIDRPAIPTSTKHAITEKQTIGEEVSKVVREGSIREVQIGLLMDINVARAIKGWLDSNILILEKQLNDINKLGGK